MKNIKLHLLVVILLVGFSCGKTYIPDPDPDKIPEMLSMNVPEDFDWTMSSYYDLVFSNGSFAVIEVTSDDESLVFHRGTYIENDNGEYVISLKLPDFINNIKVNSRAINLNSDVVLIDLSLLKTGSVLKINDADGDGIQDSDDDYPNDAFRATNYFWPDPEGTLVFEDLWPGFGDYDFNDLVVGYQFKTVKSATNRIVEIVSYTTIRAHGAMLQNGFGFELPNAVAALKIDLSINGSNIGGNIISLANTGQENSQDHPVVIVIDNIANVMDEWVNTIVGSYTAPEVVIAVTMTPTGDYVEDDFKINEWNPFIFIDQERAYELHLANYPPTTLGGTSRFQTVDDSTNAAVGRYYVSRTNLPWALDIPIPFEYPREKQGITEAYLHFRTWAESGGTLKTDWFSNTAAGYRNSNYIYY